MPKKLKSIKGLSLHSDGASARRFNRSLSVAAREVGAPTEVMIEWLNAILAGHGQATIQEGPGGEWFVEWPESGEITASDAFKQWAWVQLRQAGYGMPSQAISIEAEVRASTAGSSSLTSGTAPPAMLIALRQALALTASSNSVVQDLPVIDVVPESSEGDDLLAPTIPQDPGEANDIEPPNDED